MQIVKYEGFKSRWIILRCLVVTLLVAHEGDAERPRGTIIQLYFSPQMSPGLFLVMILYDLLADS